MSAFVTVAQFLKRYDSSMVAKLVVDDGVPETSLTTNENLIQAILDASGEILMSCLKGGRYDESDLDALAAETSGGEATAARSGLEKLTCDITWYYLLTRRGQDVENNEVIERAFHTLESLRKGDVVFPIQTVIDAGHMHSVDTNTNTFINQTSVVRDTVLLFPARQNINCN